MLVTSIENGIRYHLSSNELTECWEDREPTHSDNPHEKCSFGVLKRCCGVQGVRCLPVHMSLVMASREVAVEKLVRVCWLSSPDRRNSLCTNKDEFLSLVEIIKINVSVHRTPFMSCFQSHQSSMWLKCDWRRGLMSCPLLYELDRSPAENRGCGCLVPILPASGMVLVHTGCWADFVKESMCHPPSGQGGPSWQLRKSWSAWDTCPDLAISCLSSGQWCKLVLGEDTRGSHRRTQTGHMECRQVNQQASSFGESSENKLQIKVLDMHSRVGANRV